MVSMGRADTTGGGTKGLGVSFSNLYDGTNYRYATFFNQGLTWANPTISGQLNGTNGFPFTGLSGAGGQRRPGGLQR